MITEAECIHKNEKKEFPKIKCRMCREIFEPIQSNQKLCSEKCRNMYNKEEFDEIYIKECHHCEKEFGTLDPRKIFCSSKCNEKSDKEWCLVCSDIFTKTHTNQQWCGNECKQKLKKNNCDKCDKVFFHRFKKKFCSKKCSERECKKCNNLFIPKSNSVFCSEDCLREFYTHECKACEEKFFKKTTNAKFCSKECQNNHNSAIKKRKICKHCKMIILVVNNDFDFCNIDCRTKYIESKRKGKEEYKTDEEIREIIIFRVDSLLERRRQQIQNREFQNIDYWNLDGFTNELKRRIIEREKNCCYICEKSEDLDVHHILPRKLGGSHDEDNLVALCRRCHRHVETGNREHAINKCFKNAKEHMGKPMLKWKEKINKIEYITFLENKMNEIYEQIYENKTEELSEAMMLMDDFIDELSELKNT